MNISFDSATQIQTTLDAIIAGDRRKLAGVISRIENETEGYIELLQQMPFNSKAKVIGITGPPGAGKSTLTDALIGEFVRDRKTVAVLCIDPSSPFHLGALLGDRIRMSEWYNNPDVFIRSMATRGALGGLHPKIIEVSDLLKCAGFDYILVETVGVGQSEIDIAGLADTTIVVLVPEAGDEVQVMKAGLMEIADVFVVNKSDRPHAATFAKNLQQMIPPMDGYRKKIAKVLQTVASEKKGITQLVHLISEETVIPTEMRTWLLTEKLYQLIAKKRMLMVSKEELFSIIEQQVSAKNVNIYKLAALY